MMVRRCDRCRVVIEGTYFYADFAKSETATDGTRQISTAKRLDFCPKCEKAFAGFLRMEDKPHDE